MGSQSQDWSSKFVVVAAGLAVTILTLVFAIVQWWTDREPPRIALLYLADQVRLSTACEVATDMEYFTRNGSIAFPSIEWYEVVFATMDPREFRFDVQPWMKSRRKSVVPSGKGEVWTQGCFMVPADTKSLAPAKEVEVALAQKAVVSFVHHVTKELASHARRQQENFASPNRIGPIFAVSRGKNEGDIWYYATPLGVDMQSLVWSEGHYARSELGVDGQAAANVLLPSFPNMNERMLGETIPSFRPHSLIAIVEQLEKSANENIDALLQAYPGLSKDYDELRVSINENIKGALPK